MIEESGSISLTIGSGSGRPKNIWILRIRIRIRSATLAKIPLQKYAGLLLNERDNNWKATFSRNFKMPLPINFTNLWTTFSRNVLKGQKCRWVRRDHRNVLYVRAGALRTVPHASSPWEHFLRSNLVLKKNINRNLLKKQRMVMIQNSYMGTLKAPEIWKLNLFTVLQNMTIKNQMESVQSVTSQGGGGQFSQTSQPPVWRWCKGPVSRDFEFRYRLQCCGSGMFISDPGSWFLPIPDPNTAAKERGEKKFFFL